jgi:phage baseplate assembly protein W
MHLDYPYHLDPRGRTATTDAEDHLRDLIELVLFTQPGERVHRPTFGCGLLQLVFAPNDATAAAAIQVAVLGALQQWLGDLIEAEAVQVTRDDATLRIDIRYLVRRDRRERTATFTRSL